MKSMTKEVRHILAALLLGTFVPAGPAELPARKPAIDEAVHLETATGTLHGTLILPGGTPPHPVALIIAGSGPTNRDGNSAFVPGRNDSLKMLAESLAAHDIASVRYDKRGVAQSASAAPQEIDLRFDMFVEDAAVWVQQLQADPRFSTTTLVGHSEGALIGLIAARRARADAFVSIAGAAHRASELLRDQLRPRLSPELWRESERILVELEAGRTTAKVPAALSALYRPSVQPYLISWFRYVPSEEILHLRIPILIAHGTTDIQVATAEAHALKQAKAEADLFLIEGMNHVLKTVSADAAAQQRSYSDPTLPVTPALVEKMARFIKSVPRKP